MDTLISVTKFLLLVLAAAGLVRALYLSFRHHVDPQGYARDTIAKSDRDIAAAEREMNVVAERTEEDCLEHIEAQRAHRRAKK